MSGGTEPDPFEVAEGYRVLMRARSLLAMAESSTFPFESRAFRDKARTLAERHGIEPALLRYPREPLRLAVVVAELHRLREALERLAEEAAGHAPPSAEWAACLDEYDVVLEAAAELLDVPVPRLPYGCRRHFRPEQRAEIETLLSRKAD